MTSCGEKVVRELSAILADVADTLDWEMAAHIAERLDGARRVYVFGAGRSGGIALAIGQRLGHIGLSAVRIGEAGNSRFGSDDVLVIVSGSGETPSALTIAELGREAGGSIVLLTTAATSRIGSLADAVLVVGARRRLDASGGAAPFTAPFDIAALAVGEALAKLVMHRRGLDDGDIESYRPNVE